MNILVVGSRYCCGNKKTGGSFEFSQVFAASPINNFQSENFSVISSAGCEPVELNCTKEVVNQLQAFNLPCEVTFIVTNELRNGQLVPLLESVDTSKSTKQL